VFQVRCNCHRSVVCTAKIKIQSEVSGKGGNDMLCFLIVFDLIGNIL
jgi:hypothetical protein